VVKPIYDTLQPSDLIVSPMQVFISLMQLHVHIFELLVKIIFLASGSGSISNLIAVTIRLEFGVLGNFKFLPET
jgi:hypothetical protein